MTTSTNSGKLPHLHKPSSISLTSPETSLIQNIHRGYEKIILEKEFGGGYSGTRVFLVLPVRPEDVTDARVVTKIGPADQLEQEKKNSERISRAIPFSTTQVREYIASGDGWAALSPVFAGGERLGNTMSLEEYYRSHPVEEVIKTLRELLGTVLGENVYRPAPPLTCHFRDEYNRHLPEHERFLEIVRVVFPNVPGLEGETIELPALGTFANPLNLYPRLLDQPLQGRRSLVHGDLHLRNVLVDQQGKGLLIDFAKVEERHNLFDFIKLEVYIRIMMLSPEHSSFSLHEYLEFEQALSASIEKRNVSRPSNQKLKFAFDVILSIRKAAEACALSERNFRLEYLTALLLYTLASMKYHSPNNDIPARLLFVTACALATDLLPNRPIPKLQEQNSILKKSFKITSAVSTVFSIPPMAQ